MKMTITGEATPTPTLSPIPTTPAPTATPLPLAPLALVKNLGGDYVLYGYEVPAAGDWTYWDAYARNPSSQARDFWSIPLGNNAVAMAEVDADGDYWQELAILKVDPGDDYNLYLYNSPYMGDWSYSDAFSRNPSPLARDFWQIPSANDILIADGGDTYLISMKDENGDTNLYLYNSPYPGDWFYWDAVSRNPSPLARDFWQILSANDTVALCGLDTTGDGVSDSLLTVSNEAGDFNVYLWNMPAPGDYTYWDAFSRNPSPFARDFWKIPEISEQSDIARVVGIRRGSLDELGVLENNGGSYTFYIWNAPRSGDWTYWYAFFRNPSPLARDFWKIPLDNDIGIAAPRL